MPLFTGITVVLGGTGTGKTIATGNLIPRLKAKGTSVAMGEVSWPDVWLDPSGVSFFTLLAPFLASKQAKYLFVDSLSFLLAESGGRKGGLLAGGISRASAQFFATLDGVLRALGKSLIAVINPLSGRPSDMSAFSEFIHGVVTSVLVTQNVSKSGGELVVRANYTTRGTDRVSVNYVIGASK
jgi:hypothetical protein